MTSTQRIALVTGASRGIGRAVALALANQGWRVICLARAQKALEKLDDEIKSAGKGDATLVPIDLRDGDAIDALAGPLLERFGRIDALAACAGVLGATTPAHQANPPLVNEVFAVNVIANQRLIRALHPLLRASDAGRAVFLSSGVAHGVHPFFGVYAASKAALEALVRSYAAEIAITPMRANLFNPGPTRTAMRAKAFPGEDPMTLPAPEDVAAMIVPMLRPAYAENGVLVQFRP